MPLFKEVKRPVLKGTGKTGAEISAQRPRYIPKEAPCAHRCPNGNDIREVLTGIAQAKEYGRTSEQAFERAWRLITANNPFPAICGRICSHGCENGCNRKSKDGAVAINAIERFIGDFGISRGLKLAAPDGEKRTERIAVLGAGAAGLSCAYHLARRGYSVTVFEAFSQPGGVFRYGVPRSRVPDDVLDAEIGRILELGVELKCNCAVGWDMPVEQIQAEYQASFVGVGAQRAIHLKIAAENAPNVYSGTAFLNLVNRGERTELGDKVVVIGDDLLAMEAARFCRRIGVEVTTLDHVPDGSESELRASTIVASTALEPEFYAPEALRSGKGRIAAEEIDARLRGRTPEKAAARPSIGVDRLKLDYYAAAPRHEALAADGPGLSEAEVLEEAKRCMSCGMCMDCESCWMYCSNNCFIRLPKGEHYGIRLELCNGCKKCADACPCGYIELT